MNEELYETQGDLGIFPAYRVNTTDIQFLKLFRGITNFMSHTLRPDDTRPLTKGCAHAALPHNLSRSRLKPQVHRRPT